MKPSKFSVLLLFISSALFAQVTAKKSTEKHKPILFTENKGQFYDQNFNANNAVLFAGSTEGLNFFLKNNGLSYQFQRIDSWKKNPSESHFSPSKSEGLEKTPDISTIYRLDISWMNTNDVKPTGAKLSGGLNNYYYSHCPDGITGVQSFEGVYYKNIYNNIDLHYYSVNGRLKYDYIVAPNTDHKVIRFKIDGAKKTYLRADGSLVIETPLGNLIEDKPVVFQEGKVLQSKWILKNNEVSFEIKGRDFSKEMIIDPAIRNWATYYGTSSYDISYYCAADSSGNVFMSGYTSGNGLATSGVFQTTMSAPASAYLVKFDVNGNRTWCTYYGNYLYTFGRACAIDLSGNVYLSGQTTSTVNIASAGAHQTSLAGNYDAFVAKFTSTGIRIWGTYFGGTGDDQSRHVSVSPQGDVFINGLTLSPTTTLIASPGAFQTAYSGNDDGFIAMFNSSGVRQWSTYFGSSGSDLVQSNDVDAAGNVYFVGYISTSTGTSIVSAGSYQSTFGGGQRDGFIAKFSNTGQRIFCTYYGGTNNDVLMGCDLDNSNNLVVTGIGSGSVFASSGAYQATGLQIIAKFSASGNRIWGSFFGPSGDDSPVNCITDRNRNIFVTGLTSSPTTTLVSTAGNYQTNNGGGSYDAYFMRFDSLGFYEWGTYYGSTNYECGWAMAVDTMGHVYGTVMSNQNNSSLLATPNSFQPNDAGGNGDGLLVQFYDCQTPAIPVVSTPSNVLTFCSGASTTLTATGSGTLSWYSSATSTNAIATGSTLPTQVMLTGYPTFYVEAKTCAASRSSIQLTVHPNPIITVNNDSICSGKIFTITASGASTYTYSTGQPTLSANATTPFTVTGTSIYGCVSMVYALGQLFVYPLPTITVNSGSICSGNIYTIVPSGALTYSSSLNQYTLAPVNTTTYWVTGTSPEGCVASAPTNGTVTVFPSPIISVNSGIICKGENFVIIPGGASNYSSSTVVFTLTPSVTQTYSVKGENTIGCVSLIDAIGNVIVNECLGVAESDYSGYSIYPNPNNGSFVFRNNDANSFSTYQAFDALGQIISSGEITSGDSKIDLSTQANGIYFIKLFSADQFVAIIKIVVED